MSASRLSSGIFSKSDAVIALGAAVLRMVAVSEPFYGFSIIVEGMMQGVGKTKAPFVYNMMGELIDTYVVDQNSEFIFNAAHAAGYYLVEVRTANTKTTLRYIVK